MLIVTYNQEGSTMILKPITVNLADVLLADDKHLTLTDRDNARLLAHIPEGDETFLTIQDNLYSEWVKATNQCGTIVLERAIDGSEARKFPKGSCVFFETSVPVIKWLICNHDCCKGECETIPVGFIKATLPIAIVGQPWEGRLQFSGSLPINFDITGMPAWMTAEYEAALVRLSGTPDAVTVHTVSVAATNAQGSANISKQFKVNVVNVPASQQASVTRNAAPAAKTSVASKTAAKTTK